MSTPIFDNNNIYSFKEYLTYLLESFDLRKTSFGVNIDMNNNSFNVLQNKKYNYFYYTFYNSNDTYFLVVLFKKKNEEYFEIGFATSKEKSIKLSDYSDDIEKINLKTFTMLKNYNKIIYIISILIKELPIIKKIKFGSDKYRLDDLYKMMIKNKSFSDVLSKLGFTLKLVDKFIHYEKI
jgi:hypothetical protein